MDEQLYKRHLKQMVEDGYAHEWNMERVMRVSSNGHRSEHFWIESDPVEVTIKFLLKFPVAQPVEEHDVE